MYLEKLKLIKDVNKLNERVARLSNRNPDDLLKKQWADYCMTCQIALEMNDKKPMP